MRDREALELLADVGLSCARGAGDVRAVARATAERCVAALADSCAIYSLQGEGLGALAIAHVEPAKVEVIRSLHERWPLPADSPYGLPAVLQSGRTQLMVGVTEDLLVGAVRDPVHLSALRSLDAASWITAPLSLEPNQPLGALVLVRGRGRPDFDPATSGSRTRSAGASPWSSTTPGASTRRSWSAPANSRNKGPRKSSCGPRRSASTRARRRTGSGRPKSASTCSWTR